MFKCHHPYQLVTFVLRLTRCVSEAFKPTFCLKISLYTFLANIEEAESTEESAEDITAAETAPRPKNATALKDYYEI